MKTSLDVSSQGGDYQGQGSLWCHLAASVGVLGASWSSYSQRTTPHTPDKLLSLAAWCFTQSGWSLGTGKKAEGRRYRKPEDLALGNQTFWDLFSCPKSVWGHGIRHSWFELRFTLLHMTLGDLCPSLHCVRWPLVDLEDHCLLEPSPLGLSGLHASESLPFLYHLPSYLLSSSARDSNSGAGLPRAQDTASSHTSHETPGQLYLSSPLFLHLFSLP